MAPGCDGRGLQATGASKSCRCQVIPASHLHMLLDSSAPAVAIGLAMEVTLWHDKKDDADLSAPLYKAPVAPVAAAGTALSAAVDGRGRATP